MKTITMLFLVYVGTSWTVAQLNNEFDLSSKTDDSNTEWSSVFDDSSRSQHTVFNLQDSSEEVLSKDNPYQFSPPLNSGGWYVPQGILPLVNDELTLPSEESATWGGEHTQPYEEFRFARGLFTLSQDLTVPNEEAVSWGSAPNKPIEEPKFSRDILPLPQDELSLLKGEGSEAHDGLTVSEQHLKGFTDPHGELRLPQEELEVSRGVLTLSNDKPPSQLGNFPNSGLGYTSSNGRGWPTTLPRLPSLGHFVPYPAFNTQLVSSEAVLPSTLSSSYLNVQYLDQH